MLERITTDSRRKKVLEFVARGEFGGGLQREDDFIEEKHGWRADPTRTSVVRKT